ncbi:MAG: phosphoenolpyruvate synthase [Chitinophagaceae bacterium]|nr:phosphoenolpyruvate synthase [Oligoflexus sp.]
MLVLKTSTQNFAKREAGGKGYNLYLMSRLGVEVPDWTVLGRTVYETFLRETGLTPLIETLLKDFAEGRTAADVVSQSIENLIVNAPMPESVKVLSDQAFAAIAKGGLISVRSSATDEDGAGHSFAGQLSSFLYVESATDALRCLKLCWASGYSDRCLFYRKENNLALSGITVAVVFQLMIDPEQSGVLFTCDPLKNDLAHYLISAVYGVGEGLVSGALDADTFWISRETGELVRSEIVEKREAFRRSGSGLCDKVALPETLWNVPSLQAEHLKSLHDVGQKLQTYYGTPQDVEWAVWKGKTYILQTRPVTTLERNLTGFPNLWDNSNIVESYGGLTSPLSFTFALVNYKKVYVQFCDILGLSADVVKDMEPYLGNMLGCINGRVYYNLYNWYKLVGVLPGFSKNRQFMETMMGVGEELSPEIVERIRPHPSWDTWKGKVRKVRTGLSFLYFHFAIQGIVDTFLTDFKRDYDRFRKFDFSRMASDELFEHYLYMDINMLGKWKAPIINDFLCMVHFGILKGLTGKWLTSLGTSIQNDLLAGEGNLESAEPTKELIRMAGDVAKNTKLKTLLETAPVETMLESLNQSEHQSFYKRVCAYIDRFGFRCMSEMKLEEIDLLTDPSFLFVCLKNYLRSGTTDLAAYEEREHAMRANAETAVRRELSGIKKIVYFWSLKHARKAVKNRENTRFSRTRAYGIARTLFRAMGADLASKGIIDTQEDIWYLTMPEVWGVHQGTLPSYSLKKFIAIRKVDYARFEAEDPKVRFQTRGGVYWKNDFLAVPETADIEEGADYHLKGLPCCPGIIEGIVKVVSSPKDDLSLNGEILVTARTDPGWVPLYPSISGLLVERGSLLSHSAIVAREMGLPTIVGIKGLTNTLRSGMRIRLDGGKGTITILEDNADAHFS